MMGSAVCPGAAAAGPPPACAPPPPLGLRRPLAAQRRRRRARPSAAAASLLAADAAHHAAAALQHSPAALQHALADMLTLGNAAAAAAPAAAAAADGGPPPVDNGWLTPLVTGLETVLKTIRAGLDRYRVPYSYGWSIVALTAGVKLATTPLTKKQVESSLAMQALKPKIDAIKARYGDDKAAVQRETSALYEKAGVNPLAGCLPSLATVPIFIGLYRSLTGVAAEGALDNEGFYWIPSLAGPTTLAAQKAGAGAAWLLPFVDGAPPVGWETASRYLALPVALVVAQWTSSAIISPPVDPNNDSAKTQKAIIALLPLMVGWFALNVPSGLSLYYFSNTMFTMAQQVFLRKLGGARAADFDLGPIELGSARRTGEAATSDDDAAAAAPGHDGAGGAAANGNGLLAFADAPDAAPELVAAANGSLAAAAEAAAVPTINRRSKRKKRELLEQEA